MSVPSRFIARSTAGILFLASVVALKVPPISVKYDEVAVLFPNHPVRRLNTLTPANYYPTKVVKQIAKIYLVDCYYIGRLVTVAARRYTAGLF